MRPALTLALAFIALAPARGQEATAFRLTQEALDRITALAVPQVEAVLGYGFGAEDQGPVVRLAEVDEVRNALERENLACMQRLYGEEAGKELAHEFASGTAPVLLAKTCFGPERAVLLVPESVERTLRVLELPESALEPLVRSIVVHELVHVADDARFDVLARIAALEDADRIQAVNAVLEGHAEYVAEAACAALGWGEAREVGRSVVLSAPPEVPGEGEGVRLLRLAAAEGLAMLYRDGERYVRTVLEAAPDRAQRDVALAALFDPGPRDFEEVLHPEWTLAPGTRPVTTLDLDRALEAFQAPLKEDGWITQRLGLTSAQLGLAFAPLPEEQRARLQGALRRGRLVTAAREDAMRYLLLAEWENGAEARHACEASERLVRLRDEQMQEGAIVIRSASYRALEEPLRGVLAEKRIAVDGQEFPVTTALAVEGALTIELLYSGEAPDSDAVLQQVRDALAHAVVREERR